MTDFKTKQVGGEDSPVPVLDYGLCDANTVIEGGRLVWTRLDTGYMTNSTYALANPANVRCWGVCQEHCDNSTPIGGAPVNAFNNPGTAGGATVRYSRSVFLVSGDGSVLQAQIGLPVFLLHDGESGQTNTPPTITVSSGAAGVYPFVGCVTTNPRSASANPDPSKIPVLIGTIENTKEIPKMEYLNDATVHTAAFTVAIRHMHKINPSGATFAYTFPAITQANDGMHLAVVNVSTGSTATVAAPTGSDNIGNSAGTSTGATAAGPSGGATIVYTADNTQKAWLVGI